MAELAAQSLHVRKIVGSIQRWVNSDGPKKSNLFDITLMAEDHGILDNLSVLK